MRMSTSLNEFAFGNSVAKMNFQSQVLVNRRGAAD